MFRAKGKSDTPNWLRSYWLLTLLLFAVTIVSYLVQRRYFPNWYPYNNPVFQYVSRQFDYYCFATRFKFFGTTQFFTVAAVIPFTYPAPVALVYEPFYAIGGASGHHAYLGVCAAGYVCAAVLFGRALQKRGVSPLFAAGFAATMVVTSYPAALQFFLGNVEALMWIILALGIWAWYRDRFYLAALCFGLATSMKIFPFVYFGLLEARRKYKETIFGLAVCAVVSIAALRVLGPLHESYGYIHAGLVYFQKVYVENFHRPESGMDHSLFSVPKLILWKLSLGANFGLAAKIVLAAEAVGGLALYPRIRKLSNPDQLLALSVASVLLPVVSHDYTLLHMYAPFAVLVLCAVENRCSIDRIFWVKLVCFAILFSSQNYLIRDGTRFAGQFKSLALLTLGALAIFASNQTQRAERSEFPQGSEHSGSVVLS